MSTLSNEDLARHLQRIGAELPSTELDLNKRIIYLALAQETLRLILWNRAQSLRRLVGLTYADTFRAYALSEPLSLPPDSWNSEDPLPPLKPRAHEITDDAPPP